MGAQEPFERDVIPTSAGDLSITFIGHGSLLLTFDGREVYVDPYTGVADYSVLPKADVILITHEHSDHLDLNAIASIRTEKTVVILTRDCASQVSGGNVLQNGEALTVGGMSVEAVAAYNIVHKRDGRPIHPPGRGNGYVMTFGDKRIYVAGDTENIPEMKALKDIACAFLPMNVPYTMTPEMVADAARKIRPRILYPYHYGETDVSQLEALLNREKGMELRIRRMS
jgi:L-ascorbate metabolism protein UlaG (beta-lactamase superfamily)